MFSFTGSLDDDEVGENAIFTVNLNGIIYNKIIPIEITKECCVSLWSNGITNPPIPLNEIKNFIKDFDENKQCKLIFGIVGTHDGICYENEFLSFYESYESKATEIKIPIHNNDDKQSALKMLNDFADWCETLIKNKN